MYRDCYVADLHLAKHNQNCTNFAHCPVGFDSQNPAAGETPKGTDVGSENVQGSIIKAQEADQTLTTSHLSGGQVSSACYGVPGV